MALHGAGCPDDAEPDRVNPRRVSRVGNVEEERLRAPLLRGFQHWSLPSARMTQLPPATRRVADATPGMSSAVALGVSPASLQQATRPLLRSAHPPSSPTAIRVASLMPATGARVSHVR